LILASDLHFGSHDTAVMDALDRLVRIDPDRLVIIPGDLTMGAFKHEYRSARELLFDWIDAEIRIVLTPGNHDFGALPGELFGLRARRTRNRFRSLMDVIGEQEGVIRNDHDMVMVTDTDVFVALRSTHTRILGPNRIRGEQIAWARGVLDALRVRDRRLHLVTHRSLWQDDCDSHGPMRAKERLEAVLLQPYRFYSFVNGHNHTFHGEVRRTPNIGYKLMHVGVPTASERTRAGLPPSAIRWTVGQAPQPCSLADTAP